ncbi:MAG: hypothetical protein K1X57_18570 [Gemmataceae bacterium]|nr:hypothetical protein [Gemmataceae bacterium]
MSNKLRTRLRLQSLEDRTVPALIMSMIGGSLNVAGTNNGELITLYVNGSTVDVKTLAPGLVTVGTFNVTGNITIAGRAGDDSLNVIFFTDFPGNVTILGEGGNDNIQVQPDNLFGTPRHIQGTLKVDMGLGDDSMQSFVHQNTTTLDGGVGSDTVLLSNLQINGNLTANRVNELQIGYNIPGLPPMFPVQVGGNVIVNNSADGALANTLVVHDESTLLGSLTYTGGSGSDFIQVEYDPLSTNGTAQINGGTVINAGAGANTIQIDQDSQLGSLLYQGGNGIDVMTMQGGVIFSGNVALNPGDGNNQYNLASGPFFSNSGFSITAGNGSDLVGGFDGQVGGAISLSLGNGANSFTLLNSNAAAAFYYTGGAGVDTVEIGGIQFFSASINLGAGADVFSYTAGATSVGSITINFGVDTDTDVFNSNGVIIGWPSTLLNLP